MTDDWRDEGQRSSRMVGLVLVYVVGLCLVGSACLLLIP